MRLFYWPGANRAHPRKVRKGDRRLAARLVRRKLATRHGLAAVTIFLRRLAIGRIAALNDEFPLATTVGGEQSALGIDV